MELKKDDLIELKQSVLDIANNDDKSRIILAGNKPILLATTIFTNFDSEEYENRFYAFFQDNAYHTSLLDCFIYTLYKELGVYGVIDYISMREAKKDIRGYKKESRYYYDPEFRRLLTDASIDALYSLNIGRFIANRAQDVLNIHELNSSFSYCGLTGVSKHLIDLLDRDEIKHHSMFGGTSIDEFKKLKINFTDDTIKYNSCLKIGKVKNKQVDRKNLWPRTLDISLNGDKDYIEFYSIFIEYLEWALNELETKGPNEAMAPMRKLNN